MRTTLKIVLTGAESTGKSTLAEGLAGHFNSIWIPELARTYVQQLDHHYSYVDIENIARMQIQQEAALRPETPFVFFDTWLLITKVWFDFVYQKHPVWLDKAIEESSIDHFILCDIDMPWVDDPLRENGGENRKLLHERYLRELEHYGFNYTLVSGTDDTRLKNAIKIIEQIDKLNR